MSQQDLADDLKAQLGEAASKFTAASDADFKRHLDQAALDFGRVRPHIAAATLTLVADQAEYTVPADLLWPKYSNWGVAEQRRVMPWADDWVGPLPAIHLARKAGALTLWLDPPPTATQIYLLGETYQYFYATWHAIGALAADTTIQAGDRGLLLLRAAAEALRELAQAGTVKPIQWHHGIGSQPTAQAPAALYLQLMARFEAEAVPR